MDAITEDTTYATRTKTPYRGWGAKRTGTAIAVVLGLFWVSIGLESLGFPLAIGRIVTGTLLLTVVPGALLVQLLALDTNRFGEFGLLSVALSLTYCSMVTVVASVTGPFLGAAAPLSLIPLAVIFTLSVGVLSALVILLDTDFTYRSFEASTDPSTVALLALLPLLAILGAVVRNRTGESAGIALFVLAVVVTVLLASTSRVNSERYPMLLFFVSISTLLHRNLVTNHVIGADIQYTYFVSTLIDQSSAWAPNVGGSHASIPIVSAVPATYAAVTGLEIVLIFKLVFPVIFSLVPLGVYYLASEVFEEETGLYAGLFFLFYHGSFYFTPGKQLISQLFVVAFLLLYLRDGFERGSHVLAIGILTVGLIHSHYGTAYVLGFSLLFASIVLLFCRTVFDEFDYRLPGLVPATYLVGATAWYAMTSTELMTRLAAIPVTLFGQVATLLAGTPAGTGPTYVQQQTTVLERLHVYIYALFLGLIGVGLAWRSLTQFVRTRRGSDGTAVGFTVLAVPFFAFVASSYVVILDLYADRVLQMSLPVLVPFLGFGFGLVYPHRDRLSGKLRPNWSVLALLVSALFVLNSGLAFAVAGTASDYTFNEDAQDYAFSDDELAAVEWAADHPDVERVDSRADWIEDNGVRIYVDGHSYQLFRAVVPESHYTIETIVLKNQWDPSFDPAETRDGYVFIRHAGVASPDVEPSSVPITHLSSENASAIVEDRPIVFQNEDVTIVGPAEEETAEERLRTSNRDDRRPRTVAR